MYVYVCVSGMPKVNAKNVNTRFGSYFYYSLFFTIRKIKYSCH